MRYLHGLYFNFKAITWTLTNMKSVNIYANINFLRNFNSSKCSAGFALTHH